MNVYTDSHLTPTPWMADASCAQIGGDAWFPNEHDNGAEARRVCKACPVVNECRDFAVETNQQDGIWGGMGVNQLRKLRNRK